MSDKVILTSYAIHLQDKKGDFINLSEVNGTDRFLNIFLKFLRELKENTTDNVGSWKSVKLSELEIESDPITNTDKKEIYGYFNAGMKGEKFKVKDTRPRSQDNFDVNRYHASMRNAFFYLHIPHDSEVGYLIIQRKRNAPIRGALNVLMKAFLRKEEIKYTFKILNLINKKVFKKIIDEGKLKELNLYKKEIPSNLETYLSRKGKPIYTDGTAKFTMKSEYNLPKSYKNLIDRFIAKDNKFTHISIEGIDERFSELSFKMNFEGIEKNFYIVNEHKIQPDIDVTSKIKFDDSKEPTLESMLSESRELIKLLWKTKKPQDD